MDSTETSGRHSHRPTGKRGETHHTQALQGQGDVCGLDKPFNCAVLFWGCFGGSLLKKTAGIPSRRPGVRKGWGKNQQVTIYWASVHSGTHVNSARRRAASLESSQPLSPYGTPKFSRTSDSEHFWITIKKNISEASTPYVYI